MRPGIAWAALDLMGSLLLVVYTLIAPPPAPAASIATFGRYAIVTTWPAGDNDVDTWYKSPDGARVWFANPSSLVAHLERDDLGSRSDLDAGSTNSERVIITAALPGEHIVNLHGYGLGQPPVPVTVELWQLQGHDHRVYRAHVVLAATGDEVTAFRFQLSRDGVLRSVNRLPASVVGP